MQIFKKFFPEVIIAPILLVVFLATRLVNILAVPIFTDEAIYTRWSQIARYDSNWRFISLTDGKQPAFVWINMIVMRLFDDPLLGGRIVSVICGLFVVIGLYFVTVEIFRGNKNARILGLIASGIAVIYPFLLVYDRLALYESMIAAFMVWALYAQILFIRKIRLDLAMITGFVMGGAVLTKSSGFLAVYLLPFIFLLFDFKKNDRKSRLVKAVGYLILTVVIVNICYAILRLSPFYHIINQKNAVFVYDVGSWIKLTTNIKIDILVSNSRGLFDWFFTYFTIPWALLVIAAFFIKKEYLKEKTLLFLWFLLPILALCFLGKTLYPRYLLFMTIPLIPLVAYSLWSLFSKLKNTLIRAILILVVVAIPLWSDYFIIFDFAHAPIPKIDLEQLINGWPAGGGIRESVEFFKEKSKNGEIMVGTQGTFGLMPAAYEIYFRDNPNVRINGFWPVESDKVPDLLLDYAQRIPTYFVFYQPCPTCEVAGIAPQSLKLTKVASYKKGSGNTMLTIYQVLNTK